MNEEFPSAAPEIPVSNLARAPVYYERCLGFHWDWGVEGIGQVSRGGCRIFLTDDAFRGGEVKGTPVIIWLNSKPWNLHEFTATDLDGNLFRVFYDFSWELPDRGGRKDDTAERDDARARS